jgi:hypothetical protein
VHGLFLSVLRSLRFTLPRIGRQVNGLQRARQLPGGKVEWLAPRSSEALIGLLRTLDGCGAVPRPPHRAVGGSGDYCCKRLGLA